MGGHDRAIFQWHTLGINDADEAEDDILQDGMLWALIQREESRASRIPRPLATWGTVDGTGKNFGPVDDIGKNTKTLGHWNSSQSILRAKSSLSNHKHDCQYWSPRPGRQNSKSSPSFG